MPARGALISVRAEADGDVLALRLGEGEVGGGDGERLAAPNWRGLAGAPRRRWSNVSMLALPLSRSALVRSKALLA